MILIDVCIPKKVAHAIASIRDDVTWLGDILPQSTPDTIWLADAGRHGWLVVTRDKHIRTRPGERRAIIQNSVGAFIVHQKQGPTPWEYLKLLVGTLEEMERLYAATPRPFICLVGRRGEMRML